MDYSQDEFFDFMEDVERQGGEHLDELCKSTTYSVFSGKHEVKPLTFPMCGNSSLFRVPYQALSVAGDEIGTHPVVACAVDDDMGAWPRFGGDRLARNLPPEDPDHKGLYDS